MNILDVVMVGVALSMDAFAITLANCTTFKSSIGKKEWSMPTFFAIFQGVMPLIGYFVGALLLKNLASISGYLTSAIFFCLSGKIIFDLIKDKPEEQKTGIKFTYGLVAVQAIATSIDALFVGVTLVGASISVFICVSIIALVTFAIICLALFLGKKLGEVLGSYAEWAGAGLLLVLAIKSLIEALI